MPTTELKLEGHKMEPWVSVPSDTVTKFAATDIADPLLDPHGSSNVYGFCTALNTITCVNSSFSRIILGYFYEVPIRRRHNEAKSFSLQKILLTIID
jgi:hypothetical protein